MTLNKPSKIVMKIVLIQVLEEDATLLNHPNH